MCYLCHGQKSLDGSFESWKNLFIEAKEAGLLYALFTGGECFLHPDFIQIYKFVYDLGIRITIYSNGFYLPFDILNALKKRPPEFVAITLYGESEATYESVTGRKAVFHSVLSHIDLLQQAHVNVMVRTIPLRPVYEHLSELISLVQSKSLPLGYFLYVSKSELELNQQLNWRLSPIELINFEQTIRASFPHFQDLKTFDGFKSCPAFKSSYYVTYDMQLKACALAPYPIKKLETGAFLSTFKELSALWNQLDDFECKNCSVSGSCIACKARKMLENPQRFCTPYLFNTASLRGNKS